jgi:hypothetical protein
LPFSLTDIIMSIIIDILGDFVFFNRYYERKTYIVAEASADDD